MTNDEHASESSRRSSTPASPLASEIEPIVERWRRRVPERGRALDERIARELLGERIGMHPFPADAKPYVDRMLIRLHCAANGKPVPEMSDEKRQEFQLARFLFDRWYVLMSTDLLSFQSEIRRLGRHGETELRDALLEHLEDLVARYEAQPLPWLPKTRANKPTLDFPDQTVLGEAREFVRKRVGAIVRYQPTEQQEELSL